MNKSKFLTITVITLILINMMTLGFFMTKGPRLGNRDKDAPKEIIIKKLHFDDSQIVKFEAIIEKHRNAIMQFDTDLKKVKNDLYNQLSKPVNQKVTDSLFTQLALIQKNIEQTHYHHFLEIKALCTANQMKDYNQLTSELAKLFDKKQLKREREHRE